MWKGEFNALVVKSSRFLSPEVCFVGGLTVKEFSVHSLVLNALFPTAAGRFVFPVLTFLKPKKKNKKQPCFSFTHLFFSFSKIFIEYLLSAKMRT